VGLIFSPSNLIDLPDAVVSASSEAGGNTASNMLDPRIGKRWRVMAPGGSANADFGSAQTVEVVALVFPRDTTLATGTVQHVFSNAGVTVHDSGAIDIGLANGYGYHVYVLPAGITATSWSWTYSLTSAYADTGRAWAGELWRPTCNIVYGGSDSWDDLSTVTLSPRSGAEFIDRKPVQRNLTFGFDALTETDRAAAFDMQRLCGTSSQVLVITDESALSTGTVLGRMARLNPILATHPGLYSQSFQIRESL